MKKLYRKGSLLLSFFLITGLTAPETSIAQDDDGLHTQVLYRLNAGGLEQPSHDAAEVTWEADDYHNPSEHTDLSETDNTVNRTEEPITLDETVPEVIPEEIFRTERNFDHHFHDVLRYNFSVPEGEGADYEVKLYFIEAHFEEPEMRTFHVDINGERVLENFDIYEESGHLTGTMRSATTQSVNGNIFVEFVAIHQGHHPTISGIEIIGVSEDPDFWNVTSSRSEINAEITVFPNPCVEQVNIEGESATPLKVTLFDKSGEVIESHNTSGTSFLSTFNTASLPAGIYYIRLEDENGAATMKKIIKGQ